MGTGLDYVSRIRLQKEKAIENVPLLILWTRVAEYGSTLDPDSQLGSLIGLGIVSATEPLVEN